MNSDVLQKAKKLERQIREFTRKVEFGKEFMKINKEAICTITHIVSPNYTISVTLEEIEHLLLKNIKKDEEELSRLKLEFEKL